MNSFSGVLLIMYIGGVMILTSFLVGKIPVMLTEPYGWDLPFNIGLALGSAGFLGYQAGKGDKYE